MEIVPIEAADLIKLLVHIVLIVSAVKGKQKIG
jgi:hypothetical protein